MAFFQPLHNFDFTDIDYNLQPHTIGLLLILIVIIVILLITSLYLYYYFVSRYGNLTIPTTTTTTTTTANFSSSSPHVMAQSMGVDCATINKLPTFLHRSLPSSKKEEQTECSICLGVFEDEERIKVLPKCQHVYHTQCVDKWLSTQSSCPLCRATVQVLQSPGEFAVIQM